MKPRVHWVDPQRGCEIPQQVFRVWDHDRILDQEVQEHLGLVSSWHKLGGELLGVTQRDLHCIFLGRAESLVGLFAICWSLTTLDSLSAML